MLDLNKLKKTIYDKITNKTHSSDEERLVHTENLINCSAGDEDARLYVKQIIASELQNLGLSEKEVFSLTDEIYSEYWGLGIIDKYDTSDIDEIMVLGTDILVFKGKEVIKVDDRLENFDETIAIMRRCLEFDKSKDLNAKNAKVEAKRKDGARITTVIPPIAKVPYLNIRKFDSFIPTTENMLKNKTITKDMVDLFKILVQGRANIVVIGEMGSGKTTFIKWLMQFIQDNLLVGILETRFELQPEKLYPNKLWVQLEERLPDYPMADLFTIMLRQNVDIIIVGECRSYEVNELIKAMSRGHSGCMGSAHSTDAIGMIDDFADMVLESGKIIDLGSLKYRIAKAVDIVVKLRKLPNRQKTCAGVYELISDENKIIYESIPLFEFEIDEDDVNDSGKHIKKNNISDNLKNKLNFYGVKYSQMQDI